MYLTIANNLFDFLEIDALPTPLKRRTTTCSSAAELSRLLMEENAGFHKTCISMYNKQKFERKRKCYEQVKSIGSEDSDCAEGPSKKLTRLKTKMRNYSESCFFCDEDKLQQKLHECMSLSISHRVKAMASDLGDTWLLGKLSEGDMVATEAKYHSKCLLDLFNQHRRYMERNEKQPMREYDFLEGVPLLAIFPNPLS